MALGHWCIYMLCSIQLDATMHERAMPQSSVLRHTNANYAASSGDYGQLCQEPNDVHHVAQLLARADADIYVAGHDFMSVALIAMH